MERYRNPEAVRCRCRCRGRYRAFAEYDYDNDNDNDNDQRLSRNICTEALVSSRVAAARWPWFATTRRLSARPKGAIAP